jgi:hypothetical protein
MRLLVWDGVFGIRDALGVWFVGERWMCLLLGR